ncbi:MAG: hypothetical protein D6788_03895 [Planctomycetota bacterium]|nr:MAG: hypothetical protein D6788_03895 [Planctomycetota bacterium]
MGALHTILHHGTRGHHSSDSSSRHARFRWRSESRQGIRLRTFLYSLVLITALFAYWLLLRACQPISSSLH